MLDIQGEYGLKPPQFFALQALDEPVPMSSVANVLRCDRSAVTWITDRLEDRGYVERRPDPDDRRGTVVEATAKGRRWAEKRGQLVREVIQALPTTVAPARLVADMARLNDALRTSTGHDEIARGSLLAR
jgi:DNA-binding MarR family transcriptional regulator